MCLSIEKTKQIIKEFGLENYLYQGTEKETIDNISTAAGELFDWTDEDLEDEDNKTIFVSTLVMAPVVNINRGLITDKNEIKHYFEVLDNCLNTIVGYGFKKTHGVDS